MAANGISTLQIPTGLTATSFTGSFPVAAGTFNYDSYGMGFSVRKDSGPVDAYINQVLALGPGVQRVYTALLFSYGEAKISFTLNADGTFSNVTVADGAGGYPFGPGVDPVIIMPGNQLVGGTTPANDIYWEYVAPGGVITGFTYRSGNPSGSKDWTFVPSNGQPSFTRLMRTPMTNVELPAETVPTWNLATHDAVNLGGTGVGQLNSSLIPNGTSFVIYANELGGGSGADKEARQLAKLNIAQAKRQGKTVARDGTISGSVDDSKTYYRARNNYDITRLPDTYNDSVRGADDNPNTGGLAIGRPWYSLFTTYEEVVSPGATISTTQTGPFKINVRSTSYDTEPFVNGQISINDVLVVDTSGRGHTVLALTPTGIVIEQTTFDTWDGPDIGNMNTTLLGYATGTVIAICTYDAGRINSTLRATLNTYYGGTLTDTWGNDFPRTSHIFIGIKI